MLGIWDLARRMGWRPSLSSVELEERIRWLAEASLPTVRARLDNHLDTMQLSEARGYVRARARKAVAVQARHSAFATELLASQTMEHVVQHAIEHVTSRLTRELMTQPAANIARRAA